MSTTGLKCPRHGMSRTRFNGIYRKIKQRCITGCCKEYSYYGGRGIKCEWVNFDEFKRDMYRSYLKHITCYGENKTTIERIDNNKNYCKENCKWATMLEQGNNKRNNIILKHNGISMTLSQWSRETGIKYTTIRQRIFVYGWSIEDALSYI